MKPFVLPLVAAAAAILAAPAASAAVVERQEVRLGVRDCQGALPAFEGALRKRPLAIQNEGTIPAFVTCAFEGTNSGQPGSKRIRVLLRNFGAAAVDVSCTLVDGGPGIFLPTYFTQVTTVAPGPTTIIFATWTRADNGGNPYTYPAVSCNLPPNVAIPAVQRDYDEDIGA